MIDKLHGLDYAIKQTAMSYFKAAQHAEEMAKIQAFIASLDMSRITGPLDKARMQEQLNIENPLVVALLHNWVELRRRRLQFEQVALAKMGKLKKEVAKFHLARKEVHDEEANWVDEDEDDYSMPDESEEVTVQPS